MQIIERDVLVDPNESGDYWYIPLVFYDTAGENATYEVLSYTSDYNVTIVANTFDATDGETQLNSSDWLLTAGDSFGSYIYALRIPKSVTFNHYIMVNIKLDSNGVPVAMVTLNIRKMASGGSGGGSGSGSSISVPTAPEIAAAVWNYSDPTPASGTLGTRTLSSSVDVDPDDIAEAVWNYGAEEGDETLTDRTLSTSVEVNPSAIAQAVWNYSVAEPASGTLGTRTLSTVEDIAQAVLTTNVGSMAVNSNEYTIKHLIMASQKSEFLVNNNEPHQATWTITDTRTSNGEPVVIASRTLTLNDNGAIVKTA